MKNLDETSSDDRPKRLFDLAREIVTQSSGFHDVRGPGEGDHATHQFMHALRKRALECFGEDFSERRICGSTSLAVDFYFEPEATVVEVALGLPNPACEFEKDVLKAIMAQEFGHPVRRLLFISRPGGAKKCDQPGRSAVRTWASTKHGVTIEIHELPGEPRRRNRSRRIS